MGAAQDRDVPLFRVIPKRRGDVFRFFANAGARVSDPLDPKRST